MAAQGRRGVPGYRSPGTSSVDSSEGQTPNYPSTPLNEPDKLQLQRPELAPTSVPSVTVGDTERAEADQKGSAFAATSVSSVTVNNHSGLHIMLPSSGSTSTVPADITSLRHCVVDMSIPTANGKPYASLTVKGVRESLLVCGQVDGPAHITAMENCVVVVSCRQFRMHSCADVDVYLSSASNPVIEDCTNIRFTRIPHAYVRRHNTGIKTQLIHSGPRPPPRGWPGSMEPGRRLQVDQARTESELASPQPGRSRSRGSMGRDRSRWAWLVVGGYPASYSACERLVAGDNMH